MLHVTSQLSSGLPSRGRPRLVDDDAVLDAALAAFAEAGYEGMSMRSLNRTLGLSHATVNQRYGSKESLYDAAIEHGFRGLIADLNAIVGAEDAPNDPLDELRLRFRAFLVASARRPDIGRLMNNEGLHRSRRLDRIFQRFVEPAMRRTTELMQRLEEDGRIVPVSERLIFFTLTQGGAMPFTLRGLSTQFDARSGRLDPDAHARESADFLVRGLLVH